MSKTFRIGAIAAVLLLVTTSASARPQEVSAEQVAQFKTGVATYDQVVSALGPPASISTNSDGTRIIVYMGFHARPKAASFIPVVGLFAGGATGQSSTAMFTFRPDGVLLSSNATATNTDCSINVFAPSCGTAGAHPPRPAPRAQAGQ